MDKSGQEIGQLTSRMQDGANTTVLYPKVAKVHETKNLYFLMLSSGIGFMLEKQGFNGTTVEGFGEFIRARAVGEGRIALKKATKSHAHCDCYIDVQLGNRHNLWLFW